MNLDRAITLPSRSAWLERRRLGSSDVGAVCARPEAHGTPYTVARRLMGLERDRGVSPEAEQGLRWEPVIRTAYAVETGRRIRTFRAHTLFVEPEGWSTSTPDGALEDAGELGGAELKLAFDLGLAWPASRVIERWEIGALPRRDWYLQTQHQCWVTGAPWVELVVLLPVGHGLRVYRVHRDDDLLGRLVPQLRSWYRRHVLDGVPVPPAKPREALEALQTHHGTGRYRKRPATPQEANLAVQLHMARMMRRTADGTIAALQVQLYGIAGRASALTFRHDGAEWVVSIVRDPPHVRVKRKEAHRGRNLGRRQLIDDD